MEVENQPSEIVVLDRANPPMLPLIVNREKAVELTHSLLRIVTGLLFMQHGGKSFLTGSAGCPPP